MRPASVSSTNASGVRTGNRGAVWPSRSVSPDGVRNFTAMPRTSGALSETRGWPPAFDQRTVTGTGSPCRWAARERPATSADAVNVPS